jgi:phosphoribosylformylglycinamidine synthase
MAYFIEDLNSKIPENKSLKIHVAHSEGKCFLDAKTIKKLNENNQILFRYYKNITAEVNTNGALENIAGICNESRSIFGIIPHRERVSDKELFNEDGRHLFESIINN